MRVVKRKWGRRDGARSGKGGSKPVSNYEAKRDLKADNKRKEHEESEAIAWFKANDCETCHTRHGFGDPCANGEI